MNTMVVNVMSGALHASIAALEGYCAFHRLLLFFVRRFPDLRRRVNGIVKEFCAREENRHKTQCPNLGEVRFCSCIRMHL